MSEVALDAQTAPAPGGLRLFWRSFAENRGAVLGLCIMAVLILLAISADVVAPHSPIQQFRDHFLSPPMWQQDHHHRQPQHRAAVLRERPPEQSHPAWHGRGSLGCNGGVRHQRRILGLRNP